VSRDADDFKKRLAVVKLAVDKHNKIYGGTMYEINIDDTDVDASALFASAASWVEDHGSLGYSGLVTELNMISKRCGS